MTGQIIDAHAHCGIQEGFPAQSLDDYLAEAKGSGICGAVMFPPVSEIYDRYDPDFIDSPQWQEKRRAANQYLLSLVRPNFEIFPYLFIWNDFAVEDLTPQHRGIKWHRHSNEPIYRYGDPRCARAIDEIRRRNMPVCLEEEFRNTIRFLRELAPGVTVVIPHLGFLNGGYKRLRDHGVWEEPNVYADTSLASMDVIMDYLERYGSERLMFGSDFPFGNPWSELRKILSLPISQADKDAITGGNINRLMAVSNRT